MSDIFLEAEPTSIRERPREKAGILSFVAPGLSIVKSCTMKRRRFLREVLAGGVLAIGSSVYLLVRRHQLRAAMAADMVSDDLPALTLRSWKELNAFPIRAREEIKRYFHCKCLNVGGFVSHICSNEFAERLSRCSTPAEREECFLYAFCSRVATETEILN